MHARSASSRICQACLALALAALCTCKNDVVIPKAIAVTVSGGRSVAIQQGQSATMTVTVARIGSYDDVVSLTVEGAPAGLLATFTPASIPGSAITSTLTLSPDMSVAPKTYAVTLRARGTGVTDATTSLSVVVTPAPNPTLTLTLDPGTPIVVQGSSATVTATIARGGGFTGAVGLSVTGAPDGLAAVFVPTSIASGFSISMLTLVASATVKPGTYSLTVTATGYGVSDAIGVLTLTVQKAVTPPPTTDVAAIVVTPDGGTASSGSTLQLTAEVIDTAGNKLTGRPVTWATSNVSVALLASTTGTSPSTVNVMAWRVGQATIAAASGGVVKYVTVTATAGRPVQLSVQPVAAQIETGQTIQLTPSAVDAAGNVVPGAGPIAWSSSDATAAAVDAAGVVRGVGPGTATISAKLGTLSASAFISVVSVAVLPGVQMIDLGTLGGSNSSALAINNLGQVVGASQLAGGTNAVSHAFLWTAAGGMVDIATPGDTKTSSAAAINDRGQVAGYRDNSAFRWSQSSGMQFLGSLSGGPYSEARGINSAGDVVGCSNGHSFLWTESAGFRDLGVLTGSDGSCANAVNDHDQVTGVMYFNGGCGYPGCYWGAFLWTAASGLEDLDPGHDSEALGINSDGVIVGDRSARAVLWTSAAGFENLGTSTSSSTAYAINTSGQIVGEMATPGKPTRAFVWTRASGMLLLSSSESSAQGINDQGQVVGWMTDPTTQARHAVLWNLPSLPAQNRATYTRVPASR